MAVDLSWTVILTTALIDSINPCAIGVLILLISTLIVARKKEQMLKIGLIYVTVVFLTYFVFGLGLVAFLASIPLSVSMYISVAVGALVIGAGILEIKDFFWYGQGPSLAIKPEHAKKIHEKMQKLTIGTVIFLGAFVAAVELPCTGGPYLAITLLLSQNFNLSALLLLIIYNIIFVMPLLIILLLVYRGAAKVQNIQKWKQSNKAYLRLVTGLILIALGWLLIMIANGIINLN